MWIHTSHALYFQSIRKVVIKRIRFLLIVLKSSDHDHNYDHVTCRRPYRVGEVGFLDVRTVTKSYF